MAEEEKPKDTKILLLGNQGVGKTCLLYMLKLGKYLATIPTIGFNVEEIKDQNDEKVVIWDVGGQEKIRPLWRHYLGELTGLVFIVTLRDNENKAEEIQIFDEIMSKIDSSPGKQGLPIQVLRNRHPGSQEYDPSLFSSDFNVQKYPNLKFNFLEVDVCQKEDNQVISLFKEKILSYIVETSLMNAYK